MRLAWLTLAACLLPSPTWAISVHDYESLPQQKQAEVTVTAVEKIISDVGRVNPALAQAIHDYFYVTPQGKSAAAGALAFGGALLAIDEQADKGQADPNKIQIEGILLGVIKRDVMSKQTAAKQ